MLTQVLLNISEIIVIICYIIERQNTFILYILWLDKHTSDTTLHISHIILCSLL